MSTNLRLCDGRTVAVRENVADVKDILSKASDESVFYEFSLASNTTEVRRIRLSAIIEYDKGHSK